MSSLQTPLHKVQGLGASHSGTGHFWRQRVTAAALRNDSKEARRELKTLPEADRAAAQSWIDKADAHDAALAVSQQFATDAMAALAKPTQ